MVDARLANSSVWPSGAAFITSMTPILVAAPGMFSTTMVPLRYLASGRCRARPMTSFEPPAANGTMTRIGLLG
jgi:hypothetical protein